MSRIHDALKRAEEERASLPRVRHDAVSQKPPTDKAPEKAAVSNAQEVSQPLTGGVSTLLDFNELQARQKPHSKWMPDSNLDVFAAGNGGNASEQFRTLRSR